MASILIIDDDANFASMMQQRLERAGHLVNVHIGPFGATKAVSQLGIDLVLLDVFMPGLSGPQLPAHRTEAAAIMSQKAQMTPERYEKLMSGTQFLNLTENKKRFEKRPGFETVYGSSAIVDDFNVANRVYREKVAADPYFDPSLVTEVASAP